MSLAMAGAEVRPLHVVHGAGAEVHGRGNAPSRLHASGPLGELHATNAPHTPLFNLPHFLRALAREQCARATAEAAPSCPKAASPAPSLKPSAAHGQTDRPSREAATDSIGDQPRPQWAFSSDESTHQLSSIAQVHAMAAGCFHRLSACLLYTSPSPRDGLLSRMPSSA